MDRNSLSAVDPIRLTISLCCCGKTLTVQLTIKTKVNFEGLMCLKYSVRVSHRFTYSMEKSPSWEANQSLQLVKQFPTFLWNHTHKFPQTIPVPSRLYPVPTTHSNFLKIHPNIILPSTSGSPQWPLPLRFLYQHPVHTSLLSDTCHMPRPSHSSRFYHSQTIV
jgi:hypothetical protein